MKKFVLVFFGVIAAATLALYTTFVIVTQGVEFGGDPVAGREDVFNKLPYFEDGRFHNTLKERDMDIMVSLKEMMGDQIRTPPALFPMVRPRYDDDVAPGLRAVWFGHASVLVEIDGQRIIFDAMLSEYAFPIQFLAPQRMNPPPLELDELPPIDAAFVSHDHYDHLDMKTVQHLAERGTRFFVGLGVGAHLAAWGVPGDQIVEMVWGDEATYNGLTIHCSEARHYSGRKSMSRDSLWASWLVQGPDHSVYHSGDSGYSPHFKAIGDQFPNIDLALIKVGDYGQDLQWQDIHMLPESSVQAHIDLGAKTLLPIHWGVFALSYHDWDEPIKRTMAEAERHGIQVVTPKLGEEVDLAASITSEPWWSKVRPKQ